MRLKDRHLSKCYRTGCDQKAVKVIWWARPSYDTKDPICKGHLAAYLESDESRWAIGRLVER